MKIMEDENLHITSNPRGTDKGTKKSYIELFYEKEFKTLRKKKIRLLEIGVRHGASVHLWNKYFNNIYITGIDNLSDLDLVVGKQINMEWINADNIKIINADAYSLLNAESLVSKYDVIIDDGPHTLKSQVFCIKNYSVKLSKDGVLIIEDILKGGLAIFPFILALKNGFIGEFKDFRSHKFHGDNCIFTVRRSNGLGSLVVNRIYLIIIGAIYLLLEGLLRLGYVFYKKIQKNK
jgi:hypothetical protein